MPTGSSLKYMMEELFSLGIKEYDLLVGNDRWKQEWATGARKTFRIAVYNEKHIGPQLIYQAKRMHKPIKHEK